MGYPSWFLLPFSTPLLLLWPWSGSSTTTTTTCAQVLAPFITDDAVKALEDMIQTMPMAAEQVLKFADKSPFSALGIERLQQARMLNTVNKRALLKNYRRLALQLHPDKCDHEMVSPRLHTHSQRFAAAGRRIPPGAASRHSPRNAHLAASCVCRIQALDGMQALNQAYDKITIPPKPPKAAPRPGARPGPRRR